MIADKINFSSITLLIAMNETFIPIEGIIAATFPIARTSNIVDIFKLPNILLCFFFCEFSKNNNIFDKEKTITRKENAKEIKGNIGNSYLKNKSKNVEYIAINSCWKNR